MLVTRREANLPNPRAERIAQFIVDRAPEGFFRSTTWNHLMPTGEVIHTAALVALLMLMVACGAAGAIAGGVVAGQWAIVPGLAAAMLAVGLPGGAGLTRAYLLHLDVKDELNILLQQ